MIDHHQGFAPTVVVISTRREPPAVALLRAGDDAEASAESRHAASPAP